MYEQDYIMRIIANLVQFLARIVFGKDTATCELSRDEEHKESDELQKGRSMKLRICFSTNSILKIIDI